MSNPFVFAVMNAFRGKLPKPPEKKKPKPKRADEAAPPAAKQGERES